MSKQYYFVKQDPEVIYYIPENITLLPEEQTCLEEISFSDIDFEKYSLEKLTEENMYLSKYGIFAFPTEHRKLLGKTIYKAPFVPAIFIHKPTLEKMPQEIKSYFVETTETDFINHVLIANWFFKNMIIVDGFCPADIYNKIIHFLFKEEMNDTYLIY